MYPVSGTYLAAIAANTRDDRIVGTITLLDDTVINITDEDIARGSLYFSEQSVSGDDLDVGSVFAGETGLSLVTPLDHPYALDGARIALQYGIKTAEPNSWEYVPLGVYYVTDISRAPAAVELQAMDGLVRLDVDLTGVISSGTPEALLTSAASKAGLVLADMPGGLPNSGALLTIPDESEIKTCRDLVMWVCQATGSFARMTRLGALEIVLHGSGTAIRTIAASERLRSRVSDYLVKITEITMPMGEDAYTSGTPGMTMTLQSNPLMSEMEAESIKGMLDAILTAVTAVEYVPCETELFGDPSLQPGDYVELLGTSALDENVSTLITHSAWRYRGHHVIRGAGKSELLRNVGSQQSKSVAAVRAAAERLRLAVDENRDDIQAAYAELQAAIEQTATDISSTTSTAIQETATGILQTVSQQYTAQSAHAALDALLQSAIAQTATDIEFAFSNATTYTVDVDDRLQEFINIIATYIRFSGEGIELGQLGSAFVSRLSHTRLSFLQNGVEIAYISNNRMYITDGQFTSSIALGNPTAGNFVWELEQNGSMSLIWRAWGDD